MKAMCPWCRTIHDSEDHDVGWYFCCCGHTRLVWVETEKGLELQPVQEDMIRDA